MYSWVLHLGLAAMAIGALSDGLWASGPPAAVVKGHIFEKGDVDGRPAYRFERSVTVMGARRTVIMRYQEITGEDLVVEKTEYEGDLLVRYSMDHLQDDEVGWFIPEVDDGRLKLRYYLRKGDDELETELKDFRPDMMVVDQMIGLLRENWDRLISGEEIEVDFVAVLRKDSIGISLKKEDEIEVDGRPAIRVKMKPRNFFVSLFVSPLYLVFERDGAHRVLEVHGRLPIKVIKNGSRQDFEGVLKLNQ